jgi:hypothetical protein
MVSGVTIQALEHAGHVLDRSLRAGLGDRLPLLAGLRQQVPVLPQGRADDLLHLRADRRRHRQRSGRNLERARFRRLRHRGRAKERKPGCGAEHGRNPARERVLGGHSASSACSWSSSSA